MPAKVALVTGCSSGIGYASALALAHRGYTVYATARSMDRLGPVLQEAKAAGLSVRPVAMDMASPASIEAGFAGVAAGARLDALVNNAGVGLLASLEDVEMQDIRGLFETNVFGLLHLTKLALPLLKTFRGTVVMMSSVAGRVSVPMMGVYCASKHALEAFSDALRMELRSSGVRVVVIEPGPVVTRFPEAVLERSRRYFENPASPYAGAYTAHRRWYAGSSTSYAMSSEQIARTVVKACESRRPAARYVRMLLGRTAIWAARAFPRRWVDAAMVKRFGLG